MLGRRRTASNVETEWRPARHQLGFRRLVTRSEVANCVVRPDLSAGLLKESAGYVWLSTAGEIQASAFLNLRSDVRRSAATRTTAHHSTSSHFLVFCFPELEEKNKNRFFHPSVDPRAEERQPITKRNNHDAHRYYVVTVRLFQPCLLQRAVAGHDNFRQEPRHTTPHDPIRIPIQQHPPPTRPQLRLVPPPRSVSKTFHSHTSGFQKEM